MGEIVQKKDSVVMAGGESALVCTHQNKTGTEATGKEYTMDSYGTQGRSYTVTHPLKDSLNNLTW